MHTIAIDAKGLPHDPIERERYVKGFLTSYGLVTSKPYEVETVHHRMTGKTEYIFKQELVAIERILIKGVLEL